VYDRGNSGVPGERECKERKMMARFRRGKTRREREKRYWMEEEERRCRMCYEEREGAHVEWMSRNERGGGKGEKIKTKGK
jgi:hypothetical protein